MSHKYKFAGKIIFSLFILIILIILPLILSGYYVDLTIIFLINLILASSFRLITTTGDFSLAHIPLTGMGAYTSALIFKHLGWPFFTTMLASAVVSMVVGLIMLFPLLRMKEFAFFIGSYAIGEALRLSWIRIAIFGSHRGISNIPYPIINIPGIPSINIESLVSYYFLTLIITIICLLFMYLIDRSQINLIFKAIHEDDFLAKSVGINVTVYRIIAFEMGTFFAGIAGVLLATHLGHIDPHQFDLTTGLYLLIWVVVGGYHTFLGPIIGVTFFTIFGEWLRVFGEWMPLLYGCILIITLLFLPEGLESLIDKFSFTRIKNWKNDK